MPRLPDIDLGTYAEAQRQRFQEATAGLLPALEFQLGTRTIEAEIPPDFDAPGGMDQWQEVEKQRLEEEYRRQQQEAEALRQQQIQEQADQYAQQQQQSEAAEAAKTEQARQEQNQASVMDQIRALGIPLPGSPFADHTASAGLTDIAPAQPTQPLSDVDQFNASASGLMTDAFGAPTPDPLAQDNTLSAGLLDRLGSAASSVGETLGSAASSATSALQSAGSATGTALANAGSAAWEASAPRAYRPGTEEYQRYEEDIQRARNSGPLAIPGEALVQTNRALSGGLDLAMNPVGLVGRAADELIGTPTIGQVIPASRDVPVFGEDIATSKPLEALAPLLPTPGKGDEIQTGLGALGRAGARAGADLGAEALEKSAAMLTPRIDDAVGVIRGLITHGMDDAALVAERSLAERTSLTLEEIQQQTRGLTQATLPGAEGLPDNVSSAGLVPEAVPEAVPNAAPETPRIPMDRGLTAEEARQMKLPGFEDLVPEAPPGEPNVRGYGAIPEDMAPETAARVRAENEALSAEQTPLTFEQRRDAVSQIIGADDTEAVGRLLRQSQDIDPKLAGIQQEMLRTHVNNVGDAWDLARREFLRVKAEIKEHLETVDADVTKLPNDLMQEAAYRATQFQALNNELSMAIKGTSLRGKAASQILNAQRAARLGAFAVGEARITQETAEVAGEAAEAARRAAGGEVGEDVLGPLRRLRTRLGGKRARRAITGGSQLEGELDQATRGQGGGGGTGGGQGGRAAGLPESETLAERLGRLKREQGRLVDGNGPEAEIARIGSEIDDVLVQAREEAADVARQRLEARAIKAENAPVPTAEELDRIVNETIGRRAISKIGREATDEASGLKQPREMGKLSADFEKAINRALTRHADDAEKLQRSIDVQVQRRVDGMLAQEKRAAVRDEVRAMAKQAQEVARRIRKNPDQPGMEDFDLILGQMREHSNVGERVANDLVDRLGVGLHKDEVIRSAAEMRAGARAIDEARIRGVMQQIDDVLQNPQAPDRAARIAGLYGDLAAINKSGLEKASALRKRTSLAGLQKSGLFAEDTDLGQLAEMIQHIDPTKPETMRPILESMARPDLWQVWREISYINMLSNPLSTARNIISTGLNGTLKLALRNPLEHLFSGGESSGVGAAIFKGLPAGARRGARLARQTMKTGFNPERLEDVIAGGELAHVGREVVPQIQREAGAKLDRLLHAVGAEPVKREVATATMGAMGDFLHQLSSRPLQATDALLGSMMYSSEAARLAQQKADDLIRAGSPELANMRQIGSKLPLREQVADHIFENIWDHPDIVKAAGKVEDYTLFRSRKPDVLEQAMQRLLRLRQVGPNASVEDKIKAGIIDFILPFYNIPYNTTKQGLENVAFPVTAGRGIKEYARGDRKAAAAHMAKAVQGGAMMTIPALLALDDNITLTGPADEGDRRVWAEHHKPMSFRAPGTKTWISYENTPWAIPFATVAGAYEAMKYAKNDPNQSDLDRAGNLAGGVAKGVGRGIVAQTFLEGAAQNFEFLTGQSQSANDIAQNVASTASRYSPHALIAPVPSGLLNFLAQMFDSVERDPGRAKTAEDLLTNIPDKIEQRLPILRNRLPEKRGAFGEVVPNARSGLAGLNPYYQGEAVGADDPIAAQLEKGSIGMPTAPREITYGSGTIPLTIEEQQEFQRLWGSKYREALEKYKTIEAPHTTKEYEAVRSQMRDYAESKILEGLGKDEIRRRWRDRPREVVAP